MSKIEDYDVYVSRMEKSMYDKIFFVDKIFDDEITTFVDFGCANGELIKYVHSFMPNLKFIGYDIDKTMIKEAKKNVPYAKFYSRWSDVIKYVDCKHSILNISSVIHEIYSYCKDKSGEFWYRVFNSGFKYVTIRDMVKINETKLCYPDVYMLDDFANDLEKDPKYGDQWREFKSIWGTSPSQIIHFLLKYRYKENWDREVHENYIPFNQTEFEKGLFGFGGVASSYTKYSVVYKQIYSLPYIVNQVRNDFGINISGIPTHMKYILKKESY